MRVDFYLLQQTAGSARWLLACRLLEKAYLKGHKVFVYCNNQHDAEHLDELLWTFKEDSFIPHNLQGEGPEPSPAVQIGFNDDPRGYHDILLNMSDTIPQFYKRFQRVMEIVGDEEDAKERSRQHYREYKAKQCELYTHTMT